MIDKSLIFKKLKRFKKFNSEVEFAKYLEISTQNLSAWYKRNTFDENKIVDKFPEINRVWLLTGEGEMLKGEKRETAASPTIDSLLGIIAEKDRQIAEKDAQIKRLFDLLEKK